MSDSFATPWTVAPPVSSVHGISQARILEWIAISFSRGSSRPGDRTQVSHITGRCFTIWTTRKSQNRHRNIETCKNSIKRWSKHYPEMMISGKKCLSKNTRNIENQLLNSKVKVAHVQLFATPWRIFQTTVLEWVAFPFSRGSSQPRDWIQVSRTAGRFFTS